MRFPLAHLRVLIDISLMAHDSLDIDWHNIEFEQLDLALLRCGVHPGVIFTHAAKAMNRLKPLKNHEDDLLRLHNEITDCLNIPRLETLLEQLLNVYDAVLARKVPRSYWRSCHEAGRLIVKMKMENPILFLNGLIYSDKFEALWGKVKEYFLVESPTGYAYGEKQPWITMECLKEVLKMTLFEDRVECPVMRLRNFCPSNNNPAFTGCIGIGTSQDPYPDCPIASRLKGFWRAGEKHGD